MYYFEPCTLRVEIHKSHGTGVITIVKSCARSTIARRVDDRLEAFGPMATRNFRCKFSVEYLSLRYCLTILLIIVVFVLRSCDNTLTLPVPDV